MRHEQEFLSFYDQYNKKIYQYIRLRVNSDDLAYDLLQDCFFKTWRYLGDNQKEIYNLRALVYKIANHLVVDWYRDKSRSSISIEDLDYDLPIQGDVVEQVGTGLEVERLMKAVNDLPADSREIVMLRYMEGLSSREINKITGKSIVNINVILHRAVKAIKKNLQP